MLGVVVLVALTALAAQSCQQAQVRIDADRAIAIAKPRAGFEAQRTQVRLVRQGLTGRPYWAVSLSVPGARKDEFAELAVVRVDANTGEVAAVSRD